MFRCSPIKADRALVMGNDSSKYGSALSALGAAILAVSVFLPWYGISLTASGITYAQHGLNTVAQQYGNALFQSEANNLSSSFTSLIGRQITTLSAHQVLKYLDTLLVVLAVLAFLAALGHLVGTANTGRGQIAFVGLVATACVLFRMVNPPLPQAAPFTLSLSWGIWLALAGSIAIVAGDLWPSSGTASGQSGTTFEKAWGGMSGWTPER